MLRTIVERISRKVVFKRRLPSRVGGGLIYVSPDSSLKFWKRNMDKADPLLFNWASEFVSAGDVVWDIGANIGLFTFAAASFAGPSGRVFAVEPDPFLVDLLRHSARQKSNQSAPVEILPAAISESAGIARFSIAERGRSASHLEQVAGSTQSGGVRETITLLTVSLDWLLERIPAPTLVKIDVEGAESQVLKGAKNLLSKVRPKILCEVSSAYSREVAESFHSHGYTLFDMEAANADRSPLAQPAFNTLACPAQRAR